MSLFTVPAFSDSPGPDRFNPRFRANPFRRASTNSNTGDGNDAAVPRNADAEIDIDRLFPEGEHWAMTKYLISCVDLSWHCLCAITKNKMKKYSTELSFFSFILQPIFGFNIDHN